MSLATVTVKNHSSRDIYIDNDPNWDDQKLLLDDKPLRRGYTLQPDRSARISVDWNGPGNAYMMGVIFADGPDYDYGDNGFYQLTIGQDEDSGLLDVTEGGGEAKIAYAIGQQTPWSMTMDFADN